MIEKLRTIYGGNNAIHKGNGVYEIYVSDNSKKSMGDMLEIKLK